MNARTTRQRKTNNAPRDTNTADNQANTQAEVPLKGGSNPIVNTAADPSAANSQRQDPIRQGPVVAAAARSSVAGQQPGVLLERGAQEVGPLLQMRRKLVAMLVPLEAAGRLQREELMEADVKRGLDKHPAHLRVLVVGGCREVRGEEGKGHRGLKAMWNTVKGREPETIRIGSRTAMDKKVNSKKREGRRQKKVGGKAEKRSNEVAD